MADAGTEFLAGGGAMGERIRAFDWARTPLGPAIDWPQSLKTAVGILLNSGYPMYIAWGPKFIQIYNDAYRPILGDSKHPAALGSTTEQTFAEIWNDIGPMFRSVLDEAKPSTFTDMMLPLDRYGFAEECFFVFSYSPVLLETGAAGGVFVTVLETTDRVLRERRQRVLKDIAAIHAQSSRTRIFQDAVDAIGACPQDVPFSAICARDDGGAWTVVARNGAADLSDSDLLGALAPVQLEHPPASPLPLPAGVRCAPWPEPVTEFVCRPILPPGASEMAGIVLFGLSPRLRMDSDYSGYHDMCALNLSAVLADAEAFAVERQRAEALAEIDQAKTAFFSNVSHEFRTPLTLMLGPLEDVLADPAASDLNARQREQLRTVHRNAQRLLRLVNSLLDFSRIEAGRTKAYFQPTDLGPFTADLVSSFRSATEKAGLDLTVDAATLPHAVYVDRDMWEIIVLNLVSNAFKFTFEGAIAVTVAASPDGGAAIVTIRDTGIGIPAHEMPHLFDRFHRIDGVAGRSIEGSGIGLALVRELVTLHGASLAVDSEVGQGTAFTITLPFGTDHLAADRIGAPDAPAVTGHRSGGFVAEALRWLPAEEQQAEEVLALDEPPRGPGNAGDRRILVVDDNADMRDYLRHLLEGHGYRVSLAANGLAALQTIERAPHHLVLSDLMMPELDGFGLLARLRANPATRHLPFIALSARAGEDAKIEGLKAGADDYLVKPFSSRELFARVDSAIELARVRRRAHEALEDEYSRLQQLFELAPSFMATTRGPNHVFEFANAAYRKIVDNRDIIGRTVEEALPEVREQGFLDLLDEVYRTGKPFVGENVPLRIQDDPEAPPRELMVNFVYEAITDVDGSTMGIFVEGHDVTSLHNANQHLTLVVHELNHRVKNMLAIVQSLSRQTFKGDKDLETERSAFAGRLTALAAAHDLLTQENWESPTLGAIARQSFAIHGREEQTLVSGPLVRLSPKTAVTLAMTIHELCTNAVKYGALSVPGGSVSLTWTVEGKEQPRLLMTWRESGGPAVQPPSRRGFGSLLIERALASELQGDVRLDFDPSGLVCVVDAPLPSEIPLG